MNPKKGQEKFYEYSEAKQLAIFSLLFIAVGIVLSDTTLSIKFLGEGVLFLFGAVIADGWY